MLHDVSIMGSISALSNSNFDIICSARTFQKLTKHPSGVTKITFLLWILAECNSISKRIHRFGQYWSSISIFDAIRSWFKQTPDLLSTWSCHWHSWAVYAILTALSVVAFVWFDCWAVIKIITTKLLCIKRGKEKLSLYRVSESCWENWFSHFLNLILSGLTFSVIK